ncbi:MAG: asparagine synthase (glutamine-hydrolyzing) [Burkholderiaceae bacterium]|nr:asparagine synthase (glutamine-hydrolyzing) [Burkholderiaceae bacterium]
MCGLAAIVRFDAAPVERDALLRMSATLVHRGPDGDGDVVDGPVGMAHRRLAIIDLATGQQPMASESALIVFNGEIYNYLELRAELIARGRRFRTASDTEVILQMYEEYGDDCVRRLNGMFAFVLYDRAKRRVLAARDHFGVKPLYLHANANRVLFASEIKALLAHPEVRAEADPAGVCDYLTFQYVQGERTMFAGIATLLPGERLTADIAGGTLERRRYWTPSFRVDTEHSETYFVERLRHLLEDAVRLQLRSDVPVGAYLSGGIDSSLVTALASRQSGNALHAFTGRFDEGPEFDESHYARMVAERCGAQMHLITPTEADFVALMPRLIYHMDEPVAGPGLFPQFMVSRVAAQHVKVVLGGQGGDEIFGGYARYLVAYLEQALKGAIQESTEEGEHIVSFKSILRNLPSLRQYQPMLQAFWREGLFDDMDRRYFRLIDRSGGSHQLLSAEMRASCRNDDAFERFRAVFNDPDTKSYYNKMTHYDMVTNLPALLQVEDRVTMASSLESRVPLLDHRIADLVASMPPRLKFRGGELKHLLKRAIADLLPAPVLDRKDKMGFPVPLHLWARGAARDFFGDVLLSRQCRERGIFEPVEVEKLMNAEDAFGRRLWGLLNLELWYRTFIDAARPAPVH